MTPARSWSRSTVQGVAQPYIVMEYVAGRTLRDVLASEGRKILPERALEITSWRAGVLWTTATGHGHHPPRHQARQT
jgi:hypothetical protein